ncbi:39S ribosomal protein L40, mitochondrial-like isoform X2 [Sinocyclocheilus anshuiensis]|uniref:39S ribosomal protein L40, mitochondrial-like isoform X2 n=1 Tax=Sinocyclocheilus anshuiensis TaxID=1608454 RepID=UPI0007BA2886|nr:PREDICTED: 39S ribosomal protein L40, mitochondrial-like isoform X2 [Sinocyclocheilus anshuiensis]
MAGIVCRTASRIISSQASCSSVLAVRHSHWFTSVLSLKTSMPLRAEPKKKVDPRREIMMKERLKKKLKRLEKVPPELIPIEDFITPAKFDETRIRDAPKLSFEESEHRALLLKEWSRYKYSQHQTEMDTIKEALEAQRQALDELKLESEELYKAAVSPDMDLFPFQHEGPRYTPPITNYEAPEGKYNNITRVYTQ